MSVASNLMPSKTKVDNCYSKPILNVLSRKWFPLSEVPSLKTTTPKNLCHQPTHNDRLLRNDKFPLNLLQGSSS